MVACLTVMRVSEVVCARIMPSVVGVNKCMWKSCSCLHWWVLLSISVSDLDLTPQHPQMFICDTPKAPGRRGGLAEPQGAAFLKSLQLPRKHI